MEKQFVEVLKPIEKLSFLGSDLSNVDCCSNVKIKEENQLERSINYAMYQVHVENPSYDLEQEIHLLQLSVCLYFVSVNHTFFVCKLLTIKLLLRN